MAGSGVMGPGRGWRWGLRACTSLLLGMLAACATQPREPGAFRYLPPQVELAATPFFPQEQHQCGPASLATGLVAAGYDTRPEALTPQLYLPAREGSLQAEMMAAARRQGALALRAPASLNGMLTEVAAGRPVIVLQNLGLSWIPRWHYAVVIGYDSQRGDILLRSGLTRREVLSARTFEYTWARSGRWGMLVLPPGELPAAARRTDVENALAALEKFAALPTLTAYYEAALQRWPDSLLLGIGLGNALSAAGRQAEAEQRLRMALAAHPRNAVVMNNLANVLRLQDKLDEALAVAERAVDAGGEWQAQARQTRDEIRAAIAAGGSGSPAPSPAAAGR